MANTLCTALDQIMWAYAPKTGASHSKATLWFIFGSQSGAWKPHRVSDTAGTCLHFIVRRVGYVQKSSTAKPVVILGQSEQLSPLLWGLGYQSTKMANGWQLHQNKSSKSVLGSDSTTGIPVLFVLNSFFFFFFNEKYIAHLQPYLTYLTVIYHGLSQPTCQILFSFNRAERRLKLYFFLTSQTLA